MPAIGGSTSRFVELFVIQRLSVDLPLHRSRQYWLRVSNRVTLCRLD
jgi:hypothetical protein